MVTDIDKPEIDSSHRPGLRRVWLFLRVSLVLMSIAAAKILVQRMGWELLDPNPLFPALVASPTSPTGGESEFGLGDINPKGL
jgi:hypothetical protein